MRKEAYLLLGFLAGILVILMMRPTAGGSSASYDTTAVHTLNGASDVDALIQSGQTAYIMYHAEWCGHCKNMKPVFEGLNGEFDDAVFAHVECAAHADVPQKYKIQAFPCIRKYEGGKQVGEMMGARPSVEATKEALEGL